MIGHDVSDVAEPSARIAARTGENSPERDDGVHPALLVVRRVLREHAALVVVALAFVSGSWLLALFLPVQGMSLRAVAALYASFLIFPAVYGPLCLPFVLFRRRARLEREAGRALPPREAWARTWRAAREAELSNERIAAFAIVFVVLPPVLSAFMAWKTSIPLLHPFAWDARFAALDRALHGGVDPWRLLYPVLRSSLMTHVIDVTYGGVWLLVHTLSVFVAAWAAPSERRRRFLTSYMIAWIVFGSGMAILFSSAGPCYYRDVVGVPAAADPYAPLLAHLARVDSVAPVSALHVQEWLWSMSRHGTVALGSGISAMPSLHVVTMTLIALYAWGASRVLGMALAAYTAVVIVGSVYLGWHYAVDGYAGTLIGLALWWGTGRLLADGRRPALP